ncbi:hypothetical protein Tco_1316285 [Tanacetum coccineum]
MRKYLKKDRVTFLGHILDKGANVKSIKNILIERNHTEVFSEYLSELPLTRIVEFRINLVPGAALVAKALYHLASSELQELSRKLQELLAKIDLRSGYHQIRVKEEAPQDSVQDAVAYQLELPQELNGIHDVFHVLNLKKCLIDKTLFIPLEKLEITNKLQFIDEPLEIMYHEVKRLKHS